MLPATKQRYDRERIAARCQRERELLNAGWSRTAILQELGISSPTFTKDLKRLRIKLPRKGYQSPLTTVQKLYRDLGIKLK